MPRTDGEPTVSDQTRETGLEVGPDFEDIREHNGLPVQVKGCIGVIVQRIADPFNEVDQSPAVAVEPAVPLPVPVHVGDDVTGVQMLNQRRDLR
nr:hypothetical protein BJQ95_03035 [Cryobacterium sp. SO1]